MALGREAAPIRPCLQYDFTFYGTKAGTSHVTLYYYTADNVKVPVSLTVTVDSDLNVSVG